MRVAPPYFGLHIVDEVTGAGIALVELRTPNGIRQITDNAGWIAWNEPGLMDTAVYWDVSGPGIEREKDGFGFRGFRAVPKAGATALVKVKTTSIARRLGRLTGQGLYHQSELLGLPVAVPNSFPGHVVGQDSVQAVPFDGRLFWLWGDTTQARYPLGNFHTTSAFTPRGAHPEDGLRFDYLLDPADPKLLRRMLPIEGPGVVWMFGLMSLPDAATGRDRMFSGFSRQKGLVPPDERGVAEFDSVAGRFKKVGEVPLEKEWPMPGGHAVRAKTADGDHFYFCRPFAHVRVPAAAESLRDWKKYEMLRFDESAQRWRWQADVRPTTQKEESALRSAGKLPDALVRHRFVDAASGEPIDVHTASIQWNEYRSKFVIIALQIAGKGAPSHLGEVWYAESGSITGPWSPAVKVATHPQYSFYNPIHHGFFDREGGRVIYFEGTYTATFSGNPTPTPRYEYNQLMYRLDLSDDRLKPAQR